MENQNQRSKHDPLAGNEGLLDSTPLMLEHYSLAKIPFRYETWLLLLMINVRLS